MSEPASALPGAAFEGIARIEEAGLRGMITIRGNLGAAALRKAVGAVVGVDFPGQGEANVAGDSGVCWMSPDEMLLLCPYPEAPAAVAGLKKALARGHYLVANVSDARAVFTVSGVDARDVLGKLCPADLSPSAFARGQIRRTRLAQAPAALWMRDDESFDLVCFRSVGQYVFDVLKAAAAPNSEVGFH